MTGTAGLNDTTIATSSAAHANTAHGHGDPTPPREAAPPVGRAGASRSDRTIALHTGVRMLSQLHARPKRSTGPSERKVCSRQRPRRILTSYDPIRLISAQRPFVQR